MDLKNQILDLINKNMNGGVLNSNNTSMVFLIAIIIFMIAKSPEHLTNLLAHPFSITALILSSLYCFYDGQIPISVLIVILVIISIVTKKDLEIKNMVPIINREHFKNKDKEEDDEDDEEDEDEEEEFSDDEDDDEETEERFVGKNYSKSNLNDTFKNLHDAIHQLENFISTSDA